MWSKPLTKLSHEFGISDSRLGRICRDLKIPLPGMGYWRKVECGAAIQRPPLPETNQGTEDFFTISSTERFNLKHEGAPVIPVSKRLVTPHPLIIKTIALLKQAHFAYYYHHSNGPDFPLNIRVSEESMPRALRLIDAFIKALEERGYSVRTGKHDSYAVIKGEELSFDLHERNDGKFVFSNKRGFWPQFRNQWRDGKRAKLEQLLGQIIVEMERLADYWVERHREEEEQRSRWEENQKRKQEEQNKVIRVNNEIAMWMQARRLRAYARAIKASCYADEAWLAWCIQYADQIDPILNSITKENVCRTPSPPITQEDI